MHGINNTKLNAVVRWWWTASWDRSERKWPQASLRYYPNIHLYTQENYGGRQNRHIPAKSDS